MIEEGTVPMFAGVNEGIRWFQEQGRWIDAAEEPDCKPSPGALIFFDWEQDGTADHVGIVENCRREMVYTIEGNIGDQVSGIYYLRKSSDIIGYGVLIEN